MKNTVNITTDQRDALEMYINYYLHRFSVETIQEKHPGFVVEDFEKVLNILEKVLEV